MIGPPKPSEVLRRYPTDKVNFHELAELYDTLLPHIRWCSSVLEVGVQHGFSLRAWEELFQDAVVHGLDCNPLCSFPPTSRIRVEKLDAGDRTALSHFALAHLNTFSFVCDDGSHRLDHQLLAREVLWPTLRVGGVYVIEDLQTEEAVQMFKAMGAGIDDKRKVKDRYDDVAAYWIKS